MVLSIKSAKDGVSSLTLKHNNQMNERETLHYEAGKNGHEMDTPQSAPQITHNQNIMMEDIG